MGQGQGQGRGNVSQDAGQILNTCRSLTKCEIKIAIYLPRTYLSVFVDQDMAKVCHYRCMLIGQDLSIKDL